MDVKKKKAAAIFEWYDLAVFSLAIMIFFFLFCVRVLSASGVSMEPTIESGDRVAIQTAFYTPKAGDVIVIDSYTAYGDPLVKRIIGMPGDVVDIDFISGIVSVNGTALEESYTAALTQLNYDVQFPVTVPEGCVFIMGDNRMLSLDSRSSQVGFIDKRAIVGKAFFCVMPLNRMGFIK